MSEQNWYYMEDGKQQGPVPMDLLRELATNGRLGATDLVWQPGMASWTPASGVEGVMPASLDSPPPLVGAVMPPPLGEAPMPDPLEGGRALLRGAAKRARRLGEAEDQSGALPHVRLMARLLEYLKGVFSESLLDQIDRASKRIGHIAYFIASILFLLFYIAVAVKSDSMQIFFQAAAVILPIAMVGQFVAVKFLDTGSRLIPNLPSRLFSGTFLQCAGLIFFTVALVPFFVGIYTLIQTKEWIGFAIALATTAILTYMGGVCLSPASVNVEIDEAAGPGEEALGILSFIMKMFLRLSPVVFGVGAIAGVGIGIYMIVLFLSDDYTAIFFAVAGDQSAVDLTANVLALGFVPFLAYLAFVFMHLFIDVLRAVLNVPSRLEVLGKIVESE